MRILLANSAFHPRLLGGAEVSTWILARALSQRGHEVSVLATTARRDEGERDFLVERSSEGVSGVVLEAASGGWQDLVVREDEPRPTLLRRGIHQLSQIHDRRWSRLAQQAIERTDAQVLHSGTLVGMSLAIWEAARRQRVPVLHTLRDVFLLCPRTTLLRSNQKNCDGGPFPCQILRGAKRWRTKGVTAISAPSHFTLRRHHDFDFFRDIPAHVVPNALEHDPAPYAPPPTSEFRGVFLGALDHYKGVGILCEVLERLLVRSENDLGEGFGFDFAGDGPLRGAVQALAERSDGRIRYHGVVRGEEKSDLLRASSFLAAPSLCEESFGRTLLDAYSHGRAVIASDRGGMPEVVDDGRSGWLTSPDVESLERRVRELIANRQETLRRGRVAHELAQRYTLDLHAERFEEIYEGMI
jgi:glycosyltransferase involved in cell wall biosynthesis